MSQKLEDAEIIETLRKEMKQLNLEAAQAILLKCGNMKFYSKLEEIQLAKKYISSKFSETAQIVEILLSGIKTKDIGKLIYGIEQTELKDISIDPDILKEAKELLQDLQELIRLIEEAKRTKEIQDIEKAIDKANQIKHWNEELEELKELKIRLNKLSEKGINIYLYIYIYIIGILALNILEIDMMKSVIEEAKEIQISDEVIETMSSILSGNNEYEFADLQYNAAKKTQINELIIKRAINLKKIKLLKPGAEHIWAIEKFPLRVKPETWAKKSIMGGGMFGFEERLASFPKWAK